MDIQEVYNHLKENMPELVVKQNEEMFKHTTFKVGGKADIWIRVKTRDELIKILSYINEEKIPYSRHCCGCCRCRLCLYALAGYDCSPFSQQIRQSGHRYRC